jgi:hypothetical protein
LIWIGEEPEPARIEAVPTRLLAGQLGPLLSLAPAREAASAIDFGLQ